MYDRIYFRLLTKRSLVKAIISWYGH